MRAGLSCILAHVQSPWFRNEPCGEVLAFIQDFSSSWGQTALYLSGGGMIGFHHFGIGKALLQLRLVPDILVGCSAGSAVAAWLASRTNNDAEKELKNEDFARVFAPFENTSWCNKIVNLFFFGYLCSGDSWTQCARRVYGDLTLAEAYERTGRILNISACRADEEKSSCTGAYLLNYHTTPNVLLRSAVLASSAFPLLSTPFTLLEKVPSGNSICPSKRFHAVPFRDGCLLADIPLGLVAREFDVGFSIVAQVNPHVYPFLSLQSRARAGRPARKQLVRRGKTLLVLLGRMEEFFREVLRSIIRLGVSLDVWPTFSGVDTSSMMDQTYRGDVTLLPRRIFWSHRFAATNLTRESDIKWYLNEGMIMAFEKTPLIRARLVIEELISTLKGELTQLTAQRRLRGSSRTVDCCTVHTHQVTSRRSPSWRRMYTATTTSQTYEPAPYLPVPRGVTIGGEKTIDSHSPPFSFKNEGSLSQRFGSYNRLSSNTVRRLPPNMDVMMLDRPATIEHPPNTLITSASCSNWIPIPRTDTVKVVARSESVCAESPYTHRLSDPLPVAFQSRRESSPPTNLLRNQL
eukprot:Blabericola_migrator_1__11720@NODE_708_length_6780_cov_78_864442_g513_i0_p1_GENE_NODE_708_length_6780_cov_78_864442_g513_i0NODE_708_length_6780_cov_78_864442_g513_i0_p1_ORF_typecomplete_len576_score63_70Patatin/PF01734_22/2_7e26Patatin/PF01734_22/1_8e03_NODE_708_length_6780_cov_78_864442_g513_i015493276